MMHKIPIYVNAERPKPELTKKVYGHIDDKDNL